MRIKLFKYFEGYYSGIQNHPKFGIKYYSGGFQSKREVNHKLSDYLLEVTDQYPEIRITIFFDGYDYPLGKYLIQFTGNNPIIMESISPFVEGPSVRIMTGCIDRLCEMEDLTLKSIQCIHSSDGKRSSILFFLEN